MNLNPLKLIQHLEDQGFTSPQSEGIVEIVMDVIQNGDLVTKDFLKAELGTLEIKMAQQETRMMGIVGDLKMDLIKWMVGLQVGTVGLILGVIYFLHTN